MQLVRFDGFAGRTAVGLLVLAGLTLLLPACGGLGEFEAPDAIPSKVSSYARIAVGEILRSDGSEQWVQELREAASESEEFQKFKQDMGVDPLEDIETLTLGFGAHPELGEMVFVIEGGFDAQRVLEGLRKQESYETEDVSGTTVHLTTTEDGQRLGSFFPADGTMVVSGSGWVPLVVDTVQGKHDDVRQSESIQKLLDRIDRTDQVWMAVNIPREAVQDLQANPMMKDLADVRDLLFSGDVAPAAGQPLTIVTMLRTNEPSSASNLHGMLTGIIQMGKAMIASQTPKLAELMGQLQLQVEGDVLKIELRADQELLAAVREELEQVDRSKLPGGGGLPGFGNPGGTMSRPPAQAPREGP